jgi:4,5-DOPA dioxygenase extradiol
MARTTRRELLQAALAAVAAGPLAAVAAPSNPTTGARTMPAQKPAQPAARMPVLFVSHGSPMIAIEDSRFARGLDALGRQLPRPKAILSISAHWYVAGTQTTAAAHPKTIHDFGGFPEQLYRIEYPAPGDPALARRAAGLLAAQGATPTEDWGLDHGTWTALLHLFPEADVPVVQLSIDGRLAPAAHLAMGRALAPLRDEGVLILGSGNVVHNLRHAFTAMQGGLTTPPDWARAFDQRTAEALTRRDHDALVRALDDDTGRLSHPTPDHYLPLLYAAGASAPSDAVRFPTEGFDLSSISRRSVVYG